MVNELSILAWASICGSFRAVYYCIAAMVMAGLDGHASTAMYTITGPTEQQILNALNGIGILLFLFGITVLPEIQDVLADDPRTGSTRLPMIKAATGVHFVFAPLYMLVGVIGFWAYGTEVASFLLFANNQPTALVVSAELLAAFQLQLVSQVMMLPVFEAAERSWTRHQHRLGRCWGIGKPDAAAAAAALYASFALDDPITPRMSMLASNLSSMTRPDRKDNQLPVSVQDAQGAAYPAPKRMGEVEPVPHQAKRSVVRHASVQSSLLVHSIPDGACEGNLHVAQSTQQQQKSTQGQQQPAAVQQHTVVIAGAARSQGLSIAVNDASIAAAAAALQVPTPASVLLKFVNRTLITGLMLLVACALPFFGAIMGFIGAVGFGPVTYALPTILYMLAFGEQMPLWEWWGNVLFIVFWLLASLLGAVGLLYAIVISASTYTFFS